MIMGTDSDSVEKWRQLDEKVGCLQPACATLLQAPCILSKEQGFLSAGESVPRLQDFQVSHRWPVCIVTAIRTLRRALL